MEKKFNVILMMSLILAGCGASQSYLTDATFSGDTAGFKTNTSDDDNPPAEDVCIVVEGSERKVCESEFNLNVLPALQHSCAECHDEDFKDFAAATSADYFTAGDPEQSLLYLKPTGKKKHKGKVVWSIDSAEAKILAEWITGR